MLPESWLWPAARLSELLSSRPFRGSGSKIALTPPASADIETVSHWIEAAAMLLGCEAQPAETPYADFARQFGSMGPALIHVPSDGGARFLAVLADGSVLTPGGAKVRTSAAVVRSALCASMEAPVAREIRESLDRAAVPASKQARALEAIVRERLRNRPVRGIWLVRLPPGASFREQLKRAKIPRRVAALGAAHALQYGLWIAAWWVVGASALRGAANREWLIPWALLLLSLIPLRVLITRLQGWIAIGAGALLKQRLFFGSLKLEPDALRHQGAGQLLGRVLESEAVEALALSGGFLAVVALIEILASIFVLAAGAGGWLQSGLLVLWLIIAATLARAYFRRHREWTGVRLDMTHDLVESMAGHRTRLAQLAAGRWHVGEDEALEKYLRNSLAMDQSTVGLLGIVPRGWLVLGLLGLMPAFVRGGNSAGSVAVAVGGILLAYGAWNRLATGAWQLAGAAVAWERTAALFKAAEASELPGSLEARRSSEPAVIEARDLVYQYSRRTEPVLRGVNLRIASGDRVVLEGASGGGKSTLVSVLAGIREPSSGGVLMQGLDRTALGAAEWRRRLAAAPQFHENHVLAETFAFNLFLGRPSVLTPADFEEAQAVCHELGLGPLLERMPAGVLQMVGETGWQLSHGERSRLYIARALLQNADLVVLDESFAALDPENLRRALECVMRRARTLLVIAHR